MSSKGIVISPPFQVLPTGGVRCSGTPSSLDIRKYLLYWDEIDYPDNNIISMGLSDDLTFLEASGILKRTRVIFGGSVPIDGKIFIAAQEHAFQKNEEKENGKWSLAQLSDSQFYTNTTPEIGIEFELANCLPAPQADVPLNDILEFKNKRRDELTALRIYKDELYQGIITAGDIPRAKIAALNKLELGLKDLDKTLKESSIKKTVTSLTGTIAHSVGAGLKASGISAVTNNSSYSFEAFCVGAVVNFILKPILQLKSASSNNPLTYIKSIKIDLC